MTYNREATIKYWKETGLDKPFLRLKPIPNHHIDHIKPLSKGGPDLHWNLQYLPAGHNLSKGDSFPEADQKAYKAALSKLDTEYQDQLFEAIQGLQAGAQPVTHKPVTGLRTTDLIRSEVGQPAVLPTYKKTPPVSEFEVRDWVTQTATTSVITGAVIGVASAPVLALTDGFQPIDIPMAGIAALLFGAGGAAVGAMAGLLLTVIVPEKKKVAGAN